MVTPFDGDGKLDLDEAARLARWLVDQGNEGLVIAGTTGEAPTLDDDEHLALIDAVVRAVDVPVVAGTGGNDTAHSIHMTREATALGAAGVLVVGPYYNRPSQAGLDAHFRAVAAATDLPVVVYDIPVRTGRKIATDTLLALAHEVPNIVALKDAAGSPADTARVVAGAPEGFEVYSGDDVLTLPLLAVGAVGVIGVATHWTGVDHQEMFDLWHKGDPMGARQVNARFPRGHLYIVPERGHASELYFPFTSPATPRMGMDAPNSAGSDAPKSSAQSFTSGSRAAGTSNRYASILGASKHRTAVERPTPRGSKPTTSKADASSSPTA